MSNVTRIARKEFASFFASITAFLFFGAFLFITLFVFFWVDTFFARNICDVRPMFEWMPALMILLVPALTMRMWSEERRSGTLELLMTAPASNLQLVLGKFIACLGLVAVALALTLPIPITVNLLGLGQLDLGPVLGGYIASLFLAGAYIAIGLFVSARTDNQIVSLLVSIFLCGLFLLVGSDPVTSLFGTEISDLLKLIGTGSRFQSITRGVIDFRDLYYYISIMGVFLSLNVLGLERLRWAGNANNSRHRQWMLVSALCIANFIAGNFWLQQIGWARVDITEGQSYTISDTTKKYLSELKEPLLIRGYFSKKTHPLLAPLVPQLRDLLKEYAIAGKGKVRVEFIDPLEDPDLEREAGEKYGIKPVVFQTASKYQAAVANAYFDVLVKYGDQHETLSFRDFIEVKVQGESIEDVELRNPEYDITSAIKKVLTTYRSEGNLFANIEKPVTLKAYFSPDEKLPEPIRKLKKSISTEVFEKLKKEAKGKLTIETVEPEADGDKTIKMLQTKYGFRPMAVSILDPRPFWFYMVLESNGQVVPVQLAEDFETGSTEQNIKAGLKKFSRGFLKTIGIWTEAPDVPMFAMQNSKSKHFSAVREKLGNEYAVKSVNFENARVPDEIDILLLLAPEKFDEKRVFAIDQFLMRGGTIIAATSPFDVDFEKELSGHKLDSGLSDWLKHHGIPMEETMVLDPKNSSFPIPVERKLGDYVVQETKKVPYPYFVDVRENGMDKTSGITSGVSQITVNWPSPIKLDDAKNKGRSIIRILSSSKDSWTSPSTEIQPDYEAYKPLGFPKGADPGTKTLAVAVEGEFDSYFKGKTPPPIDTPSRPDVKPVAPNPANDKNVQVIVDKSPNSARIILFASNSFLSDEMIELASATQGTAMLSPLTLVANSIDWSLGDRDLLSIRGRAHFSRMLLPIDGTLQLIFEYVNYGLALFGLFVAWLIRAFLSSRAKKRYKKILGTDTASTAKAGEAVGSGKS